MTGRGRASQTNVRDSGSRRRRLAGLPTVPLMAALVLFAPSSAAADILFFATGRTMSVASSRLDGGHLVVTLREGGEAAFPSTLITRIEPDEVPYPRPAAEVAAAPAVAAAMPAPASPDSLGSVPGARPFAELIATSAATHGVDVRLVHAVIEAESNYRPRARSAKGAKGLMQLMPATARQYSVRDPYDPRTNIDAGVRHLKDLLTRFDLGQALAAYNAGEATVRRFGGLPPYAETRSYVARILERVGR
jgi:soluble lytic murein transglycosylase-like protein